jgi:hypothetical protein
VVSVNEIAIMDAVRGLLDTGFDSADRDALERAARWNAMVKAFAAWVDVRCARRADELKSGITDDGFATLLAANGSGRDAKAAVERDRACNTVPQLGDALADGAVSGEHLDALARHTKHLTDDERADVADRGAELAAAAEQRSASAFDRYARDLVAAVRERHRANSDVEEAERQQALVGVSRWTETGTGMKCTLVKLDPVTDSQWWSVIDAHLATLRQNPSNANLAFTRLKAKAVVTAATAEGGGMGVPEVNIHVDATTVADGRHDHTLCELADGTPVPVATMQRFLCDATMRAVFVEPDGSVRRIAELRTPNRAQRRALAAMYATCAHPDCTVPVTNCKAHHIVWYSRQGPTLLDNLLPVCEQHHHLLHEGGWTATMTPDRTVTWTRSDGTAWRTHHSPNRTPTSGTPPRPRRQPAT